MHNWKVVPISDNQRLDVRSEDLVLDGHFRVCSTYRGGGGYDLFPYIAARRGLVASPDAASLQFVVQLFGCNLDCPYCYVTRAGVWGDFVSYTSRELVDAYLPLKTDANCNVFHLMGGAPALQLEYWFELLDLLPADTLFHSDLMLSERDYKPETLKLLNKSNVLLAVNIKGMSSSQWLTNTRKELNEERFERNLQCLRENLPSERWYLTFAGISQEDSDQWLGQYGLSRQDNYGIDLIYYEAMPLVDSVEWGRRVPSDNLKESAIMLVEDR